MTAAYHYQHASVGESQYQDPQALKVSKLIDSLQTDVSVQESHIDFAEQTVNLYKKKLATVAKDVTLTLAKFHRDGEKVRGWPRGSWL
jgi:hypothetical protein